MHPIALRRLLVCACMALLAPAATAQETVADTSSEDAAAALEILPAEGVDLGSYLWVSRVLVIFADTPADPRYVKQMQEIASRPRDLLERDVVVVVDTNPDASTGPRQELRPRGFALVMVDKDGIVKLRKPAPWSTREIARSIDKTPLRRQEIRDRSGLLGQ